MKRVWAVLALAAVAVLWSLWAFGGNRGSRSAAEEEEWGRVERQDLVAGVEVSGTLGAVQTIELGPPQLSDVWDYKIAFLAPEGSEVRQGQPVLGFDTSTLEST